MESFAAPKGLPPVALHQADSATVIVWLGVPSSPGDGGPWFRCFEHPTTGFGHVVRDSPVKCGPDHRTESTPLPSVRVASGTAFLVSPPACQTVRPELPQPWSGHRSLRQRRQLFSAGLPRSRSHFLPVGVPLRESPNPADRALNGVPWTQNEDKTADHFVL
ncbi:hypothetical protein T09_4528 [Trichinella sp. T9]|nr:hypothetical protein T09_4528 [Trichinella sp. T9]